jgi:RND superfamily putative drug exporter
MFWKLGKWSADRRWFVVVAWVLVLVGVTFGSSSLNGAFNQVFALPNTSTQIGSDLLKAHTDQPSTLASGAATGKIVFHVSSGDLKGSKALIDAAVADVGRLSTVKSISDPFQAISPNGQVAVATITYNDAVLKLDTPDVAAVDTAAAPVKAAGVSVDYGGDLGQMADASASGATSSSEIVGIGIALLILLLAFGSVIATLIPVISAVVGIFAGLGVLGILSAYIQFPSESPTIALMMGLGVGIDYALFLSTRFRQLIMDGEDANIAVARTVASSGRAVVIAAATVIISLVGLYAAGVAFVGQLGVSAGITVVVAALAAITLVPALLAIAGKRIDVLKVRKRPIAEPSGDAIGWHRYATRIGKHPVRYLAAGLALLAVLALPLFTIQIGNPGTRALPVASTQRLASDAIDSGFGAGYQAQLVVVVKVASGQSTTQLAAVAKNLGTTLGGVDGVASVTPFAPSSDNKILVGRVIPTTDVYSDGTRRLITTLDDTTLPDLLGPDGYTGYVTGSAATQIALQETVAASLPIIIFTVVGAAMLLMLLTFRSPLLALKAGITNLMSIGASYGVLVAVFQWGWGSSLLGVPQPVPIVSYVPMLMFAIIFGLSMDYEVFLLSRIRESWQRGADNRESVTHGLSVTARIITCAAVIMACVFFAFLLQPSVTIKMLALGLGVSVIVDVTIVRLLIVPAAMFLFGKANWWTPRWLDRLLPHLEP